MPQKEIAEIKGKSFDTWMQIFRNLSYEWEKVWKYGAVDNMWSDGITLNRIRQEMMQTKQIIDGFGVNDSLAIPEEMPRSYMAKAEEIRKQAELICFRQLKRMIWSLCGNMEKKDSFQGFCLKQRRE